MLGNNNNTCIRCLYLCVVLNRVNLIEFLLDHCVSRIEQKESRKRSYTVGGYLKNKLSCQLQNGKRSYIVGGISKTSYLINPKI